MKPETRLLRVVHPDNGGARKRSLLEGLAADYGEPGLVERLIREKRLVKHGDRRGARWGLPKRSEAARAPLPQVGRPPAWAKRGARNAAP